MPTWRATKVQRRGSLAEIQPGKVLYELNGVPEQLAREAFLLASAKLPLRCTFVARQVGT